MVRFGLRVTVLGLRLWLDLDLGLTLDLNLPLVYSDVGR